MVAAAAVAAFNIHVNMNDDNGMTALSLANVEALADDESGGGSHYYLCHSESRVRTGYTYYDCGSCKKVYDEQGKGGTTKCFY